MHVLDIIIDTNEKNRGSECGGVQFPDGANISAWSSTRDWMIQGFGEDNVRPLVRMGNGRWAGLTAKGTVKLAPGVQAGSPKPILFGRHNAAPSGVSAFTQLLEVCPNTEVGDLGARCLYPLPFATTVCPGLAVVVQHRSARGHARVIIVQQQSSKRSRPRFRWRPRLLI